MPIQTATQSQGFAAVVLLLKSRIVNGAVGANAMNTQIICAPDDQMNDYLGEPGYRIRVSPPESVPMTGAGRHGYISERRVDVYIVSESLADPGGQDEKAVLAHLAREDSVLDALLLTPPIGLASSFTVTQVGDLIKHVPGGSQITRQSKTNTGLIVSGMPFAVTFVPPTRVNRQ
jgi:hypothetical protein